MSKLYSEMLEFKNKFIFDFKKETKCDFIPTIYADIFLKDLHYFQKDKNYSGYSIHYSNGIKHGEFAGFLIWSNVNDFNFPSGTNLRINAPANLCLFEKFVFIDYLYIFGERISLNSKRLLEI